MAPLSLKLFWGNKRGATAIEYALIASLISIVIVGALLLLGGDLRDAYQRVSDMFN